MAREKKRGGGGRERRGDIEINTTRVLSSTKHSA